LVQKARSITEQAEIDRIGADYLAAQAEKRRFDKALHKAGLYPDRQGRYQVANVKSR